MVVLRMIHLGEIKEDQMRALRFRQREPSLNDLYTGVRDDLLVVGVVIAGTNSIDGRFGPYPEQIACYHLLLLGEHPDRCSPIPGAVAYGGTIIDTIAPTLFRIEKGVIHNAVMGWIQP